MQVRHIVSIKDFLDKDLLADLFKRAEKFQTQESKDYGQPLKHKIIAQMFYEPSTRTRFSFEAAVERLGGHSISTENGGQFSSAIKGESLEDSIKVISGYVDGIVLRHQMDGAAVLASRHCDVPVINAGDGAHSHPTQALLDLYTILKEKGTVDGLSIGLVGDLLNGRTVHALIYLLGLYNVKIYLVSPEALQMPERHIEYLKQHEISFSTCTTLEECLPELDVVYMTRVQKERFEDGVMYEALKDSFILNAELMEQAKADAVVMHPLPRVNEIATDLDSDPRAAYFRQAKNGLFLRMALLDWIFETP